MDLLTIDDLEASVGRGLSPSEEEQATYYIRMISTYIRSYTDIAFPIREETVRVKADYYGVIELAEDTQSVEDVTFVNGSQVFEWHYDGLNEIFGLPGNAVVKVTYTRGYEEVPDDLALVATEAVKRLLLAPEGQSTGPVQAFTVGDITERYAVPDGGLAGFFNDMERVILDEYRITERSYRIGWRADDSLLVSRPPDTDTAIFE